MERRRVEWEEHVTKMDGERQVKISRDHTPAGRSPGRLKSRWSDLIPDYSKRNRPKQRKKEENK